MQIWLWKIWEVHQIWIQEISPQRLEGNCLKIHLKRVICKYNLRGKMCLTKECKNSSSRSFIKQKRKWKKLSMFPVQWMLSKVSFMAMETMQKLSLVASQVKTKSKFKLMKLDSIRISDEDPKPKLNKYMYVFLIGSENYEVNAGKLQYVECQPNDIWHVWFCFLICGKQLFKA